MAIYSSKLNRSKLFLCQIGILIFYICTLATNLAKSQRHLPMHLACILVCTMFLHLHFHQQKIIFFLNIYRYKLKYNQGTITVIDCAFDRLHAR